MDELITLNLTLKELQQIDKFVEYSGETKEVFDKIKNAYPHCPDDPIWYDEVEWDEKDNPPEPFSTVFRQKLFDGIKSVFYDPDYERTHWKMKVNMTVDEVLTHFYDIIPEPQEPICDEFVKGWNSCLKSIKMRMEHTDD